MPLSKNTLNKPFLSLYMSYSRSEVLATRMGFSLSRFIPVSLLQNSHVSPIVRLTEEKRDGENPEERERKSPGNGRTENMKNVSRSISIRGTHHSP